MGKWLSVREERERDSWLTRFMGRGLQAGLAKPSKARSTPSPALPSNTRKNLRPTHPSYSYSYHPLDRPPTHFLSSPTALPLFPHLHQPRQAMWSPSGRHLRLTPASPGAGRTWGSRNCAPGPRARRSALATARQIGLPTNPGWTRAGRLVRPCSMMMYQSATRVDSRVGLWWRTRGCPSWLLTRRARGALGSPGAGGARHLL